MAKKKTEIEALIEEPKADLYADEIKEDELVVKPKKAEPLQTIAKEPAQPFNEPKEDAPKGVGGSYYIDSNGTRVKR